MLMLKTTTVAEVAARNARDATQSVGELERQLDEARKAEAEQRERAEEAARRAAADAKQREKQAAAAVAELEKSVAGMHRDAARMATAAGAPDLEVRREARGFLLGAVPRVEGDDLPHARLVRVDPAAALYFEANRQVQHMWEYGPASEVDGAHPAVRRVGELEAACWRLFIGRVRQLAGESATV